MAATRANDERAAQRGESGAVIVEFAIVFVVFVTLLWALITYGLIFALQQSMAHAAGEATRAAAGISDETAAKTAAGDIVDEQLDWIASSSTWSPGLAKDIDIQPCDYDSSVNCLTVKVTYDWDGFPVVPALLDIATPNTLTARAVLQHG